MFGRTRAGLREGWRLAAHSLSGRLLLLTIFYVMIGEVLIFVPSIGQYYRELLGNHIESAELAVMPFTLPESNKLPETLRTQILQHGNAKAGQRCHDDALPQWHHYILKRPLNG